jgi:arsenate reductase
MTPPHYNVLFLCIGNSARSIFGESLLNTKGGPTFTAHSAGSRPAGSIHPEALKQLASAHLSTAGLRSKSWDEFARPDAPQMDFVFTVCDNAADEMSVVAGAADDGALGRSRSGGRNRNTRANFRAFREAFTILDRRISLLLCLPLHSLARLAVQKEIDRIGHE